MRTFLKALSFSLACVSPFAIAGSVDINTASAEQLSAELNGVGPAKAEAIIAYREKFGPFTSVEQLTEVRGIGQATLDHNRDQILIESAAAQE